MRWFVRGDIDGFFGLALDNLVQLLVIDALCRGVLGFDDALLYGTVLPGAAVSLVVGNLYYAWQAKRLADEAGRDDYCALPYGINTVSLFAYVFLVMLPTKLGAEAAGLENPSQLAWRAGLLACFGSGLIEFGGAFVADRIRKATPRAALLSTLAGIAIGFISGAFLLRTFAHPVVGLATFAIVCLTYFGRVRFKGGLPGGLVAVVVGSVLAWGQGIAPVGDAPVAAGLSLPAPVIGELAAALSDGTLWSAYIAVILPMGLFNVVGSLQNLESAEAAGDPYPARSSLSVNGLGTMAAALFGSCFPTTIYIGHPGWKAMGARVGYSVLNAAFVSVICFMGWLSHIAWAVPVDAGMAIVLWIGIVIAAQAFQSTPREHAPAVVLGLLPGLAAWAALMAKNGLRAAGVGAPGGPPFAPELVESFKLSDTWIHGAFALEQGFIFSAMILAAATVCVIEREFERAAGWCMAGALLCALGLMHSYQFTPGDTTLALQPAWPWAAGYTAMSVIFALARYLTEDEDAPAH
jgi:AGZA family xanthine/uracil permease-like MFS transporter